MQRMLATRSLLAAALCIMGATVLQAQEPSARRPAIGLALGGGSALGLAHIGVLRWLEEHRIPVDMLAGTSMGGLIGGAYATGRSSAELTDLIEETDWAHLFRTSPYRYRSVARKEDMRAYPSRLELELRRGVSLPSALNSGQQVELFFADLAAPYSGTRSFDSLPTPFRTIAFDLHTAEPVVLDSGSLATALRATMSLPGVFPPVPMGEYLLVDGGVRNNVPADVVRAMGADVVIAVNVGRLPDEREVGSSLFSVYSSTMNALIRANTRLGLAAADVVINPVLERFDRLDWERGASMADDGYAAAEAVAAQLLPHALDEAQWQAYLAERARRRRTAMPVIAEIVVVGATPADSLTLTRRLMPLAGHRLDAARLGAELQRFGAVDRYESVAWDARGPDSSATLIVRAKARDNAPPIAMFGVNVQNVTTEDFNFQLAARYLAFDTFVDDAELRVDAALGSNPHLLSEWRVPFARRRMFAALGGGFVRLRRNLVLRDVIAAQYDQTEWLAEADVGVVGGTTTELRGGVRVSHRDLDVRVGLPGLPSVRGMVTQLRLRGTYDSQTHFFVPSSGLRVVGKARYILAAPSVTLAGTTVSSEGVGQAELVGSRFWSARQRRDRIVIAGWGGTSFDTEPLVTEQFPLGLPFRLDGYGFGERLGDHVVTLAAGYLYSLHHLPEFLGGEVHLGTWGQTGSVFDGSDGNLEAQLAIGLLVETLVGPALVGATAGIHGERRINVVFGSFVP